MRGMSASENDFMSAAVPQPRMRSLIASVGADRIIKQHISESSIYIYIYIYTYIVLHSVACVDWCFINYDRRLSVELMKHYSTMHGMVGRL